MTLKSIGYSTVAAWVIAVALSCVAVVEMYRQVARHGADSVSAPQPGATGQSGIWAAPPDAKAGLDMSVLPKRNPFRVQRRPSAIRFGDVRPAEEIVFGEVAMDEAMDLRLTGIVGGSSWRALLEGLSWAPGGRLVRAGDEVDGVQVLLVSRDSVVVARHGIPMTLFVGGTP